MTHTPVSFHAVFAGKDPELDGGSAVAFFALPSPNFCVAFVTARYPSKIERPRANLNRKTRGLFVFLSLLSLCLFHVGISLSDCPIFLSLLPLLLALFLTLSQRTLAHLPVHPPEIQRRDHLQR